MNFDWHIEINDKYRPLVNAIADLDEQIRGKKMKSNGRIIENLIWKLTR